MERLARRYGLAFCCVILPILLGLFAVNFAVTRLVPEKTPSLSFQYAPAEAKGKAAPRPAAAGAKAAATEQADAADPAIFLIAQHIAGSFSFAVACAFLYLVCAATLLFSTAVVVWRLRGADIMDRRLALVAAIVLIALAGGISYWKWVGTPYDLARPLVIDRVLNAADSFPALDRLAVKGRPTGDAVAKLIQVNTLIGLVPVGLLLVALFTLTLRPQDREIRRDPEGTLDDLKKRLLAMRCALGLGSAILVVVVLGSKASLDWPLRLVSPAQAMALTPIADALTLTLGASGTIALFAAFAPATAAWWLDVGRYREIRAAGAAPAAAAAADDLVFAPWPAVTGLMAVLAPLLASPLVNGVQSLLGALGK